jgi:hypothetical protein
MGVEPPQEVEVVCIWSHGDGAIARQVWDRLSLVERFRARRVSRLWRAGIAAMACWTPIVPPPSTAERSLPVLRFAEWGQWYAARQELEDRVDELRVKIHFTRSSSAWPTASEQRKWAKQMETAEAQLGAQRTQYDGWAALAPFTRTAPDEDASWLHGALGLNEQVAAAGRRRGRSASKGPPLRCYFQTRERDSEEGFRTWRSEPVHNFLRDAALASGTIAHSEEADAGCYPIFDSQAAQRPLVERRVRLVVAHADASLSQHNPQTLESKIVLAERVLRCYLQPAGSFDVQRGADVQLGDANDERTRVCLQGTGVTQLDAKEALLQQAAVPDSNGALIAEQMLETTPTYIVAPHMFDSVRPDSFAWFFSTPLPERGWVISTHQFDQTGWGYTPAQRLRGFVQTVVYSSLHATGLSACENTPCAMNNADGVGEMIATPMLLCPGCLRKLQLIGAMPDVPAGLHSLRSIMVSASAFDDDIKTLESWGFGGDGGASA